MPAKLTDAMKRLISALHGIFSLAKTRPGAKRQPESDLTGLTRLQTFGGFALSPAIRNQHIW